MSIKTVMSMVDWVEINLEDNPTLEKMSEHVGYSSFYCSSKFHEVIGISFKEYVLKRKMSLAAVDLRDTNQKIIDIAMKYGFSSNEAFTRAFNKVYGNTPNQFRKAMPHIILFDKPKVLKDETPKYR